MTLRMYLNKKFNVTSMGIITQANKIIKEYEKDGLDLTLRQLYYRFVAKGLLENKQANYDKLGRLISEARLAGLVSWSAIVDRTRNLNGPSHWSSPESIIKSCASSYAIDKWVDQEHRVEVWVEKEALHGVIERACEPLDIDFFCCRGYVSQSAQWRAAMRLVRYREAGQSPVIIHLGDHDPSGIDMSRDIFDRIQLFMESHRVEAAEVKRIALNMDQVETYNPPPNPAKETDSRSGPYIEKYGESSWELDALEPKVLVALIRKEVLAYQDARKFMMMKNRETKEKQSLEEIADNYRNIVNYLAGKGGQTDDEES